MCRWQIILLHYTLHTTALFTLGFKMRFGDLNTNGQPRPVTVHTTCISDFITAYTTFARRSEGHTRFVLHGLARANIRIWAILTPLHFFAFLSVGTLSPKQPPCPALMTYFPVTFLLGTHQDTLVFTLQKIWGQMHPRPPLEVV